MASAAQGPPLPPDIQSQQASPEQAQSVFAAQGVGQPNPQAMQPVQQVMAKIQELDAWAGEVKNIIGQFDPSLMPFLEQIGKAGMGLAQAVQEKAQRSGAAKGSPVVPPNQPQNPAAGPPTPNGM